MLRYSKPHVLATVNANVAIQATGSVPKGNMIVLDNVTLTSRSTTGAYKDDE
jgi:hypothetical protein